ncbi:hypothetical protein [Pelotomaculum schinkii]
MPTGTLRSIKKQAGLK